MNLHAVFILLACAASIRCPGPTNSSNATVGNITREEHEYDYNSLQSTLKPDGVIVDYGNGTIIRKKTVEMIERHALQPETHSKLARADNSHHHSTQHGEPPAPPLDIFRKMIEEVVSRIVDKKINQTFNSSLSKKMETIRTIQQDINAKVDSLSNKHDKLMETLANERSASKNATDQVQIAVQDINGNQKTAFDHIHKDLNDIRGRLSDQLNISRDDKDKNNKDSQRVEETLKSLVKEVKNIEVRIVHEVEPAQKMVLRQLKDISEGQKVNSDLNTNVANQLNKTRNLLEKEIKQVASYHNSVSSDMKRIEAISKNIESGISHVTHQLADGIKSIQNDIQHNGQKIVKDVEAIEEKSRKLLGDIREIISKQQTLDVLTNVVKTEFKGNFSKRKSSRNNKFKENPASNKIKLGDIFSVSLQNQQKLLDLLLQNKENMSKKIEHATDVLLEKINSVKNSIELSMRTASLGIKNLQMNTTHDILTNLKSSDDDIRRDVLKKIDGQLRDITTNIENATKKAGNDLKIEIEKLGQDLTQKLKLVKVLMEGLNSSFKVIKNEGLKRKTDPILFETFEKLNVQYQNLTKIMKKLKENHRLNLHDVLKEIKDTRNTLNTVINNGLQNAGLKNHLYWKNIKKDLKPIKHIQKKVDNIARNIKRANDFRSNISTKGNISDVPRDFVKVLNKSIALVLYDAHKNNRAITKQLTGEVNKILESINGTNKNLSQDMKILQNQTIINLWKGTKTILEKINDTKLAQEELRNEVLNNIRDVKIEIGKVVHTMNGQTRKLNEKIDNYLLSMLKIVSVLLRNIKNSRNETQIGENLATEFKETKSLIKTVLNLLQSNGNRTQIKLENARQNLLRLEQSVLAAINNSDSSFSQQLSNFTTKLGNQLNDSACKNSEEHKRDITTMLKNSNERLLKLLWIIYKQLSRQVNENGKRIVNAIDNKTQSSNRENQTRACKAVYELIVELEKIGTKQNKIQEIINKSTTDILNKFGNISGDTWKSNARLHKDLENVNNTLIKTNENAVKTVFSNTNLLLDKIKENNDYLKNIKLEAKIRNKNKLNDIVKKVDEMGKRQLALLNILVKIRDNLSNSIERIKNKLGNQVKKLSRGLKDHYDQLDEEQKRRTIESLRSIYDIYKDIKHLGKNTKQYLNQLARYLLQSKRDISDIEFRLINTIHKATENNAKQLDDPKTIKLLLKLIQKSTRKIREEWKKSHAASNGEENVKFTQTAEIKILQLNFNSKYFKNTMEKKTNFFP